MQKTKSPGESSALGTKNYMPDVKRISWAYVVTLLLYALAGGPPYFTPLFVMGTVFCALNIFLNSDCVEKKAIAWVMVVYLTLTAVAMTLPRPGGETPEQLRVGMWIIYKLLYVFVLAFLLPTLIDELVQSRQAQTWAIIIAFTLVAALAFFIYDEKKHESHAQILCETVEKNVCTPIVQVKSWYTFSTVLEDVVFGIQVTLLLAAFSFSGGKKEAAAATKNQADC